MCHTGGLLRRASMVVHLEANGLEARFWIASDWPTNREFNGQNDHCGSDREKQFKDSTTLLDFWIAVVKSQLACRCAA